MLRGMSRRDRGAGVPVNFMSPVASKVDLSDTTARNGSTTMYEEGKQEKERRKKTTIAGSTCRWLDHHEARKTCDKVRNLENQGDSGFVCLDSWVVRVWLDVFPGRYRACGSYRASGSMAGAW